MSSPGPAPSGSRPSPRRLGVRAEFALCALVIAAVSLAGTLVTASLIASSVRDSSREQALDVARRTSAAISVGIESGVGTLTSLKELSDLDALAELPPGPATDARCQATLALLSSQGFSFVVADEDGTAVCTGVAAGATESERAAATPVLEWLTSTSSWQQLGGVADAPLDPGRITLDPGGRVGNAAVAIPLEQGSVAVWLAGWRAFVPPLDAAVTTPGIQSVMVLDNDGDVLVATPRLVDGQSPASAARPESGTRPVADPLGESEVYRATSALEPGTPSGVVPSSAERGGPVESTTLGDWVSAPVPRLPAHVAVAYSDQTAAAARDQALRSGLAVTAVVLLVSLGGLLLLANHVGSPLARLARATKATREGAPFEPPTGGPAEVRALSGELADLVSVRSQVAEIASAARERERERVARLLSSDVAQRIAGASLLVGTDPAAAQAELAAATDRLAQVTAELDPQALPTGGVGPALVAFADTLHDGSDVRHLSVEDHSRGQRLDAARERVLYRTVLEVLNSAWETSTCDVAATVQPSWDGLSVELVFPDGTSCVPLDDPAFFDRHEFSAAGGSARRSSELGGRALTLEV